MAITYNIENDIRYKQGFEVGFKRGIKMAEEATNKPFVTSLIQNTDHSDEKIAALVDVSLQFVAGVRKSLSK